MVLMFGALLRAPMTRLITPLSRGLLSMGITANMVTTTGAIGTIASSIYFFGTGKLFSGTIVITAFFLCFFVENALFCSNQKETILKNIINYKIFALQGIKKS